MSATIEIEYFAALREQRGLAHEVCPHTTQTAAEYYATLQAAHGLTVPPSTLRVACNDAFVDWDYAVQPGDRLAFIPPVAGG